MEMGGCRFQSVTTRNRHGSEKFLWRNIPAHLESPLNADVYPPISHLPPNPYPLTSPPPSQPSPPSPFLPASPPAPSLPQSPGPPSPRPVAVLRWLLPVLGGFVRGRRNCVGSDGSAGGWLVEHRGCEAESGEVGNE